jgi:hypothetical protein
MSETLREWLLKIAKAVEEWNTMPKDDAAVRIVNINALRHRPPPSWPPAP